MSLPKFHCPPGFKESKLRHISKVEMRTKINFNYLHKVSVRVQGTQLAVLFPSKLLKRLHAPFSCFQFKDWDRRTKSPIPSF